LRARLQNFDVVHIFGLYDFLGPAVAEECRRCGAPYVVEPIGMFVPIVRSIRLKRMYHAIWGRAMLGGAGFLIATSEQECDELASAGLPRERIVLRRNGVDEPVKIEERGEFRKALGIAGDAKLVLFLGRLSKKKSPDLLLKAFAKLPAEMQGKSTRLAFVGPDERGMQVRLAETARSLGVAGRVHFAGALFERAKWVAYGDADVFVLPSQNENFGNTAAEAAAVGTPVIVTTGCGIAPILANRAALVVTHDEESIFRAMERVLGEPGLHAQLKAGCLEVASRLGWEDPAGAMEILYGRLVEAESRVA
jgi:glycosyltransferase involved in cell wall biosynthesis